MPIPDHIDIANLLEDLAAGLRLDPESCDDHCWLCVLHGPGACTCGVGLTAREAAADAWVGSWELPQLLDCIMGKAAPTHRTAAGGSSSPRQAAGSVCAHTVAARNASRATGRG